TISRAPFFVHDIASTHTCTLSLHDALPISKSWYIIGPDDPSNKNREIENNVKSGILRGAFLNIMENSKVNYGYFKNLMKICCYRSEEHTSELQSRENLVCRLLLEKKKKKII